MLVLSQRQHDWLSFKIDQVVNQKAAIVRLDAHGSPAETCVIAFVCASMDVLKTCKTLFNTMCNCCYTKSQTQIHEYKYKYKAARENAGVSRH